MRALLLVLLAAGALALLWIGPMEGVSRVSAAPAIALDPASGTIELAGLGEAGLKRLRREKLSADEWAALLAVHSTPLPSDDPPMAGSWEVTGRAIRFIPRYPLVPGLRYSVRFDAARYARRFDRDAGAENAPPLVANVMPPRRAAGAPACVTAVYPSAGVLPANQLKFYLVFSAPMSAGEAFRRVRLLDESGEEVPRAFLRLEQELWDAGRRRLTMILDPGRIKRGLRSNLEDGAPLQEGRSYRLVIDAGWRDGDGNPLCAPFEKPFRAGPADRSIPDSGEWRVAAPAAGTRDPLQLALSEPLDYAMLEERIVAVDAEGREVVGRVAIGSGEQQWAFLPAQPWREGSYSLRVSSDLEDRAGNDLRKPFDVDLTAKASHAPDAWVRLPFDIAHARN